MTDIKQINDDISVFLEKFAKDHNLDSFTLTSYLLSYSISLMFVLLKDREKISEYIEQLVDSYDRPSVEQNKTLH
jgi:hypothetical protein